MLRQLNANNLRNAPSYWCVSALARRQHPVRCGAFRDRRLWSRRNSKPAMFHDDLSRQSDDRFGRSVAFEANVSTRTPHARMACLDRLVALATSGTAPGRSNRKT
eukprot:scaffold593960_cov28-Prasinocladus_malaysianus.AAC.1